MGQADILFCGEAPNADEDKHAGEASAESPVNY